MRNAKIAKHLMTEACRFTPRGDWNLFCLAEKGQGAFCVHAS